MAVNALLETQRGKASGAYHRRRDYHPGTTLRREIRGIVQKTGIKGQKTINEIGSSREIQSIVLPQLELQVGNFPAILRPAYILMNEPDNACHYGSLGMDLMKQSERTTIDFESMTLRMR